ncbi:MAG: M55 family metallopeptidase [Clostridia bacterium]|nr:M55 family metallopeptidase [Clostridia bacterium]MDD4542375.1 M55 family metallopeptidase [Clostridia bacterium]
MNVLIVTDLEGVIGIDNIFLPSSELLLFKELEVIIECLESKNVQNISICYSHDGGRLKGSDYLKLRGYRTFYGLDNIVFDNYDYAIMSGFHAKKNSGGVFDHTLRHDIDKIIYDGEDIGEIQLFAYWLETKNVPVRLVIGEAAAIKECAYLNCLFCDIKNRHNFRNKLLHEQMYAKIRNNVNTVYSKNLVNNLEFHRFDTEKVFLRFINYDIAKLMGLRGYTTYDDSLMFNSLDALISNLNKLALELNEVYVFIVKENSEFAIQLRKQRDRLVMSEEINYILNLPIDQITSNHKEIVVKVLNNHE